MIEIPASQMKSEESIITFIIDVVHKKMINPDLITTCEDAPDIIKFPIDINANHIVNPQNWESFFLISIKYKDEEWKVKYDDNPESDSKIFDAELKRMLKKFNLTKEENKP